MVKKPLLLVSFLIILFMVCSCSIKACKIRPDLEKIGDSALKNKEKLTETNLQHANVRCDFQYK